MITTYQTLNLDFSAPDDLDSGEEMNWLRMHGCVQSSLFATTPQILT